MKKTYVKPALMVESFVLNQNIAANCGVPGGGNSLGRPTHGDRGTCGWDMGGIILWASQGPCNTLIGPDEEVDIGCYNNPTPDMSIFGS